MKNLLILFFLGLVSNFVQAENSANFPKLKIDNVVGIACREFSVEISIGIASVSSTVYICCGDMFAGPPPSIPCRSVTKRFYELYQANQSIMRQSNGIAVSELFPNVKNLGEVKYITVVKSSVQIDEQGNKIEVRKGNYPIVNGKINLEYEILK